MRKPAFDNEGEAAATSCVFIFCCSSPVSVQTVPATETAALPGRGRDSQPQPALFCCFELFWLDFETEERNRCNSSEILPRQLVKAIHGHVPFLLRAPFAAHGLDVLMMLHPSKPSANIMRGIL